jgi:hypothetical protein
LQGVHGVNGSDVFAVGADLTINPAQSITFHWDGSSWNEMNAPGDTRLTDVWAAASDDVWAVGQVWDDADLPGGRILHYDGASWSVAVDDVPSPLDKIWGSGADDIYAVGYYPGAIYEEQYSGVVMHYDGVAWTQLDIGTDKGFTSVSGRSAEEICLGAQTWNSVTGTFDSSIVLYDGATFTPMELCGPGYQIEDMWMLEDPGSGIAISREGTVYNF